MKHKSILEIVLLLFCLASIGLSQTDKQAAPTESKSSSSISVEAQICRAVSNREPSGADTSFSTDVGALYCWCRVTGISDGSSIKHVWVHDGKEVRTIELPVKTNPYRTWSQKNIPSSWTGTWEVRITDVSGNLLKTVTFTVGE